MRVFACIMCLACIARSAPASVGELQASYHDECAVAPPIATMTCHGWRFKLRLAVDYSWRWWAWNSDSLECSAPTLGAVSRLWMRSAFLPIGGCR